MFRKYILVIVMLITLCLPGFAAGAQEITPEIVARAKAEAEKGDLAAQYNLGVMYADGKGVPQNYVEAVKWYKKAAMQGYAAAQYYLGVMYADGKGVPQNYAEAVKWYKKAAAQGHAKAQYNLGVMYARGEGARKMILKQ